jgi:ParB family transcriptional regulator, chromosome partitioning protein
MPTIAKHARGATKKSKPIDHTGDLKRRDKSNAADLIMGAKSSSVKVLRVRIADIAMPKKWRSIQRDKVHSLASSMNQIGLRMPISVRERKGSFRLVAGRHRLEAAIKLGWKRIDAVVMHDKFDRRIWHNAENLDRAELTVLERAEAVTQQAKDVAEKVAQTAQRGGRQPHDKGVSKAAKAIGVSRDNVRRSKKIAAISPKAKAAAVEAGMADNERALLKVAKETAPNAQVRVVHELAKPKRASKPELSGKELKQFKRLKHTFAAAKEHRRVWKQACKIARDRFIAHIRKPATQ